MKEATSLGMGWEEFISCFGGGEVAQEFADSGASFAEGSGKIARGEELGKGGKVQGGSQGMGVGRAKAAKVRRPAKFGLRAVNVRQRRPYDTQCLR